MSDPGDGRSPEADVLHGALADAPDPAFARRLRDDIEALAARAAGRLWWFEMTTTAGVVRFVHDGRRIHLATNDLARFEELALANAGFIPGPGDSARLRARIERVLAGRARPSDAVALAGLAPFHRKVLEVTAAIPRGEARTYGWVAAEAGAPGASRAAGTALARNPVPFLVPCHRVVRGDWSLGNYSAAGGPATKERLLRSEGVDLDRLDSLGRAGIRLQGCRSTGIFCLPTCRTGRHMRPENVVPFRAEEDARAAGFRPCRVCRPARSAS